MDSPIRPRVKICCIASAEEARLAVAAGAAAVGFVSAMPSGPGILDEERIAEIAPRIPPGVASFLLTCAERADAIVAQQRRCRTNTLQLCDRVGVDTYARLRDALPGVALVQVIHVVGEDALREAEAVAPHVDAVLLDSGDPTAPVKQLGGTGRRHDWAISRRIRDAIDTPLYLAGGLRADNVAEAIATVAPFGVDVCSGVRTNGALDPRRLRGFFDAVSSVTRTEA